MEWRMVTAALALGLIASAGPAYGNGAEKETLALVHAETPLVDAIRVAEKDSGGMALEADFEMRGDAGEYEVEVLSMDGKQVIEYRIDAATGEVKAKKNEPVEKLTTRIEPGMLRNAPTDLAVAVVTAQKSGAAIAEEAKVEKEGDKLVYDVKLVTPQGMPRQVRIDAGGKLASSESSGSDRG